MTGDQAPSDPVWITGVGVVAACGSGAGEFWRGLHTPAEPATRRSVATLDTEGCGLSRTQVRRMDRFSQLGVAAATEALEDARLIADRTAPGPVRGMPPSRLATCIGTGLGGGVTLQAQVLAAAERGIEDVAAMTVPMVMANAAAAAVSIRAGATGPCETVTTACAAGGHSIAAGVRWIQWGLADVVIAGGADTCLIDAVIGSFTALGALSPSGISRPFDVERDGFCISEGAGVVVLESAGHARNRGAEPYARIAGSGSTADAYHLTASSPDQAGAKLCLRNALADAGVAADDVTHVNAHGTSTPMNDAAEATALAEVFGPHRPAVTSGKGATGHPIGAAGGIEAVALALTYRHRRLPPTLGTRTVDRSLGVDVVLEPREWTPAPAVSTSFAFGGHNVALVFTPAA